MYILSDTALTASYAISHLVSTAILQVDSSIITVSMLQMGQLSLKQIN